MGFLQRRAERRFYESLDKQFTPIAEAAVEFFSTLRDLAADPTDEVPEPAVVTFSVTHGAPESAACLCLIGQYVLKVSYNLAGSPPFDLYWDELLSARGRWETLGPDHLQLARQRPARATRTYRCKLYETPNGWVAFTPYEGRGGEGYYAPMSSFALIRAGRQRLGAGASSLDRMMDLIVDQVGSSEWDVSDRLDGMFLVHKAMEQLGLADPRQLLQEPDG
jgi:hypothetical protein